jgi:DNA replication and repair protein RecF
VALALKLAEARLMQQRSGDTPVLLLDDLLSELDAQRRAHLLQTVGGPGQQTLVTATDMSNFDSAFLSSATCLRVEEGRIYHT